MLPAGMGLRTRRQPPSPLTAAGFAASIAIMPPIVGYLKHRRLLGRRSIHKEGKGPRFACPLEILGDESVDGGVG